MGESNKPDRSHKSSSALFKIPRLKVIKELLGKHNVRLKKGLGQHFLLDKNLLNKIADAASLSKNDLVLEVGTGSGALTKILAEKAGAVVTVEIDQKLIAPAKEYLKGISNIELINDDILEVNIPKIMDKYQHYKHRKVVANVPYYITTPLISLLLESKADFGTIVVLIQKEVAQRIIGKPGTKDYGSFTVYVNYYAQPEISYRIPASSFTPRPKVDSAVLKLVRRDKPPVIVRDEKLFFKIVNGAFRQRRKMLRNALINANIPGTSKTSIEKALEAAEIDGKRRGETLSIEEFADLSSCF